MQNSVMRLEGLTAINIEINIFKTWRHVVSQIGASISEESAVLMMEAAGFT
jgi:hypothetical protein